ncbi:uncharacterized protein TA12670 [Theileria annulata]|uniref:Uncharacterized protein n=1 Tax=Theileria annulata TaxID=5874 RepID=Q4UE50_THEAN|nr:uncharacterized protein TA12670 [Theileria annulata]CAI74639.1 hypothetical protein TA12670 [Theileria annulata]|eukprot:XP_952371.1 hypothetical protein TA12670 [Theileria annulata]
MNENTLVLAKLRGFPKKTSTNADYLLHKSQNDNCRSDLKSVDMYLANKKFNINHNIENNSNLFNETLSTTKRPLPLQYGNKTQSPGEDFLIRKRRNYSTQPSNTVVPNNNDLLQMIANGDQSIVDKIKQVSTTNYKKIMDLLNRSTSIKEFQTNLQALVLDMCIGLYTDKSQDETVDNLKKRVNYLTNEKALLSNVIKSQYESIKDENSNASKTEEEKQALKAELGRLKRILNSMVYNNDNSSNFRQIADYVDRYTENTLILVVGNPQMYSKIFMA